MTKQSSLELGKKLKYFRFQINANQKLIALQLGMTQQAYSYLENGKVKFTEKLIEKICAIFNINFHEFITTNNIQSPKTKLIPKTKDGEFDVFATSVMIANLKKQIIEKELRIVQLELLLKTKRQEQNPTSEAKPIYVLI